MKKIIVSVTNDLTTDQRVDRVCQTLSGMGFEIVLIGRRLPGSLPLKNRRYITQRMSLLFRKGPFFYAEYNLRLFFYLLFARAEILLSNDLDTLLANYLASKIRRRIHVHDCHEYFRGVPELNGRPRTVKIWKMIEDFIFPKLTNVYAVNESIASLYKEEYGNEISVIRNVPFRNRSLPAKNKQGLGIPEESRIILYQGAINVDRGLEEAVMAMKFMTHPAILLIIGTGDIIEQLRQLAIREGVNGKVVFTGQIPLEELSSYTMMADIGLSIEKDVCLNYHFSLPNKFLDYIQSGIPVLISPLPEMKAIVDKYQIGETIKNHDPRYLADKLDAMLNASEKLADYRLNLKKAAEVFCWENEESTLMKIFEPYV